MISNNVTLVLGAGASKPYGFPLGGELKDAIVEELLAGSIQAPLFRFSEQFGFREDYLKDFALALKYSNQPSVDSFLEDRPEFREVGKYCISTSLIQREISTSLHSYKDGVWYDYLLSLMGNRDEFLKNKLSIVTFNYDRSLEYFLFTTLLFRFHLSPDQATEYIKSVNIIHAYGDLGKPAFMTNYGRGYNHMLTIESLRTCIDSIKFIHDENAAETFGDIHKTIGASDTLIFLGFGFHRKNVERLNLRDHYRGKNIIFTHFGRLRGEVERDKKLITSNSLHYIKDVIGYDYNVRDFLRNTNYLV